MHENNFRGAGQSQRTVHQTCQGTLPFSIYSCLDDVLYYLYTNSAAFHLEVKQIPRIMD